MEELAIGKDLEEFLTKEGYKNLRVIPGRGVCGLMGFAYTVGLVWGIDKNGYCGRWCYPREKAVQAVMALSVWNGVGDPPFEWLKYKGNIEYWNPNVPET
jgi:hypothetical protein